MPSGVGVLQPLRHGSFWRFAVAGHSCVTNGKMFEKDCCGARGLGVEPVLEMKRQHDIVKLCH